MESHTEGQSTISLLPEAVSEFLLHLITRFCILIGLVAVMFYSFLAVISFWVSEATRFLFFIQFVLDQGHSDGVRLKQFTGDFQY